MALAFPLPHVANQFVLGREPNTICITDKLTFVTTKVQCSSQHSIFTKVGNAAPLGAMQSSGWMGGFVAGLAGWLPHKF